jgi:hypothetical protein
MIGGAFMVALPFWYALRPKSGHPGEEDSK